MTKLISILIFLVLVLAGWKLIEYWQQADRDREQAMKQDAARLTALSQLPGMPHELQPSLEAAENQGAVALRNWLRMYDPYLQDPRKAWIELDYCVMIARKDPSEARRIFIAVRDRTPPSSPIWPRVQELKKCYE